ncbi:Chondroitin AC/alginate lyase [Penicillium robsamsonii]|uniref:Chondroitin AC/alginate lyase n=1 Tax=Penicillium robsamsonii TaxID=1792511 RepID=UPI002548E14F|nr:Chondroitin AC/alginate lyase [Penicillium robsamsonii]KAJ5822519.1 Chondroitin AC/alginate lyase [Penicillium robsamsonii]
MLPPLFFEMVAFLPFVIPLLPLVAGFVHPGLLVSNSDITRTQKKIKANQDPWTISWNTLTSLSFSDASYTPSPVSVVYRSTWDDHTENAELLWHDVAAAFDLGLRWKISQNTSFADAASNILHAWAITLTAIDGGDDKYLTAGLQGYELANAAELLRDYQPFVDNVLPAVVEMANNIFIPMHYRWLNHEEPSEHNVLHFFANWELCNIASAMAMAVITDNQTVWDFAVDYFKTGEGTGAINNAISNIVEEPGTGALLGQGQESGRDQGHSALDIQLLGVIGQQAWNQGEDLFAYNDSRILRGAEYFARYNLGNDVPFVYYTNGIVSHTEISSASRGAIRPTWELLYSHYVTMIGMDAPWTTLFLNNSLDYYGGAEGGAGSWGEGSGHYDGLGWGSLLYRMDESDVVAASSSKSTSPTANPTPRTSITSRATATTSVVSRQSAIASSSTTIEVGAVSDNLVTKISRSSTIADNSGTFPSSTSSTTSTSISTALPNTIPDRSHEAHHHHHHVEGQAQNVCHCDRLDPVCSQYKRAGKPCGGYRDVPSYMFRDENGKAARRSAAAKAKTEPRRRLEDSALESDISTSVLRADILPSAALFCRSMDQLTPTLRITTPMSTPLEDQGLRFFINSFVTRMATRPNGSIDVGGKPPSPHFGAINLHRSSRDAVISVGLAALSNVNNDRALRILSREKHALVIKAVREVVQNPTQANPDKAFHLIVMLSIYEMVSCALNQLDCWIVHADGAAALLKQSTFRLSLLAMNHRAHLQFYFVSIVKYFAKRVITLGLLDWSPNLIPSASPDILPGVGLVDILIRFTKFDACLHHEKVDAKAAVDPALSFEGELREWGTHLPTYWSFTVKQSNTYEYSFRDQCHVYKSMWVSKVLNHYRWARLLVNETIVSLISRMAQPTADNMIQRQQALDTIACMAIDICAGAACQEATFKQGVAEDPSRIPLLNGIFMLLFPLGVAGGAAGTPDEVHEWVVGTLERIGRTMGIQRALEMIPQLKNQSGNGN